MKICSIQQRFGRKTARTFATCGLMAGALLTSGFWSSPAWGESGNQNAFGAPVQTASYQTAKANGSKSIVHGDREYKVMTADGVPTAASASRVATVGSIPQSDPLGSVMQASCLSCGTNCGGSCGSSGFDGGYGGACSTGMCGSSYGGFGDSYGGGGFAGCGTPCDPYMFVMVEALYMQHQGDARPLIGQSFRSDDFDFEWGTRLTFGSVPDCVHGMEITYVGPFDWDLGMSGPLNPALNFAGTGGAMSTDSLLGPFFDDFTAVDEERVEYSAEFWSLEANKTLVGWEVAKVLFGGRYINYDESYRYSFSQPGAAGSFNSETDNSMYGLQIGLDMLFPVSCHGYMDFRGRAGGYLNFAESNVGGFKGVAGGATPTFQPFSDSDDSDIAGVFELGAGYRYDLGQMLSMRAGVEGWYVTGVANAEDQARQVISRGSFQSIDNDDDFFVFGFNFGAQIKY
ncbi:hypothetical protein Q31b_27720 [Novipirellula aureliae]|uniref:Uncharacterized protein n=1 Tax=Novipirellula aureliae TaxID=2527966 RepID=A0A5C6DVD2_9BACT|nr:hypothetical protein [Novipirellula aureliae]TWU41333.1 hypothetical protein Q31b_27720 [Novipirellula aureliae]